MINGLLGLAHRFIASRAVRRNPADTRIRRIGLVSIPAGGSGRAQLEEPDFNLDEITAAYDTDSYVRQAVDKYTDLIFKAGWEITSANDEAREYVKLRLELISEATQTPLEEFFVQIAEDLVKYGNVFIAKARRKKDYNFPPGVNVNQVGDLEPVVGYFVLPPSTVKIQRDKNGAVKGYEQDISGDTVRFKPDDVIHLYWKRKRGMAFGIPFLIPVLPDIRLLREIEDNVNRLLHKYLHPLYKFQVGIDKDGFQSTPEEIEEVRSMVERMPTDGTLVLPERYDVEVIGAQGEAINASWALKYFEQRVFTGLGIPEIVFGRGASTNRSTADNLTSEMHDRVKAFQRVISTGIIYHIIGELLLEGGFDVVMEPEDQVVFEFLEIAIDEQIKLENQATYLYEHNAISFPEMRERIGYEQTVDESQMHLNRVKLPSMAAPEDSDEEEGDPETNNKQKPENQHGKKSSPKKSSSYEVPIEESTPEIARSLKIDELLENILNRYESLRSDVLSSVLCESPGMVKQIPMIFQQTKDYMLKDIKKHIEYSFVSGVLAAKIDKNVTRNPDINISLACREIHSGCQEHLFRLLDKIEDLVMNKASEESSSIVISSIFDLYKAKVRSLPRQSTMIAYNRGYAAAAKNLGSLHLVSIPEDNCCSLCLNKSKDEISLEGDYFNKIPPWHINCWCKVKIDKNGGVNV